MQKKIKLRYWKVMIFLHCDRTRHSSVEKSPPWFDGIFCFFARFFLLSNSKNGTVRYGTAVNNWIEKISQGDNIDKLNIKTSTEFGWKTEDFEKFAFKWFTMIVEILF